MGLPKLYLRVVNSKMPLELFKKQRNLTLLSLVLPVVHVVRIRAIYSTTRYYRMPAPSTTAQASIIALP
jgi:hypothetical protein